MTKNRVQKTSLPDDGTACPFECVYRKDGICDEPRTNKGNSDATCHNMSNKKLIHALQSGES